MMFSQEAPVEDLIGEKPALEGDLDVEHRIEFSGALLQDAVRGNSRFWCHGPDNPGGDERRRLQQKEERVNPLLTRSTEAGVEPLVFGHEEAGEHRQSGINH